MQDLEKMLQEHNQLFEEPVSEPDSDEENEDNPIATIETDSQYELWKNFELHVETKLITKLNSKLINFEDTEKLQRLLGRVDENSIQWKLQIPLHF